MQGADPVALDLLVISESLSLVLNSVSECINNKNMMVELVGEPAISPEPNFIQSISPLTVTEMDPEKVANMIAEIKKMMVERAV